ncbi:hypothetical protein F5Y05DRAFT_410682 [Hypoxylon sp. FL0543]|nr:hypothetical protein F5Y05DRAFT_410682 [Hypoxylon sp. FL0543]
MSRHIPAVDYGTQPNASHDTPALVMPAGDTYRVGTDDGSSARSVVQRLAGISFCLAALSAFLSWSSDNDRVYQVTAVFFVSLGFVCWLLWAYMFIEFLRRERRARSNQNRRSADSDAESAVPLQDLQPVPAIGFLTQW